MKKEIVDKMSRAQLEVAHNAYTALAGIYEDVCNGPMNARAYREYFSIMDSRESIRRRWNELNADEYGRNY